MSDITWHRIMHRGIEYNFKDMQFVRRMPRGECDVSDDRRTELELPVHGGNELLRRNSYRLHSRRRGVRHCLCTQNRLEHKNININELLEY